MVVVLKFINAFLLCLFMTFGACAQKSKDINSKKPIVNIDKPYNPYYSHTDTTKLNVSDLEWQKILSPAVYDVSRHGDTERPFTGKYWDYDTKGTYYCAACGNELFQSDAKFSSTCGWPSFFEQSNPKSVVYKEDNSFGMKRIEALCGRCNGHLGHLFDDGPAPTQKRYCMNSIVLDFEPYDLKKTTDNVIDKSAGRLETITFGGGCFWCIEAVFDQLKGVKTVVSGYAGGDLKNPTYHQVSYGGTKHAEVVQIVFDPADINYDTLLEVFWHMHDPTTLNRQGADEGTQYRSIILYNNENQKQKAINSLQKSEQSGLWNGKYTTEIVALDKFYTAEEYHQKYFKNNPTQGYCNAVIAPKIDKFKKLFYAILKPEYQN